MREANAQMTNTMMVEETAAVRALAPAIEDQWRDVTTEASPAEPRGTKTAEVAAITRGGVVIPGSCSAGNVAH